MYLLYPTPPKNPYRREELLLVIKTMRMAQGSVASSQACRKSHVSTKESAVYLSNSALVLFYQPRGRELSLHSLAASAKCSGNTNGTKIFTYRDIYYKTYLNKEQSQPL